MNISKEHIEQLIFEYHEGNLSDGEKSELMNIIHQHPEFESDFALWAQTYAHVEDVVPNYGLETSLLQKTTVVWHAQTWIKACLSTLIITGGIWGYFAFKGTEMNNISNINNETEIVLPTKKEPIIIPANPIGSLKSDSPQETNKIENVANFKNTQNVSATKLGVEIQVEEKSTSLEPVELVETTTIPSIENKVISKPDTLAPIIPTETKQKPETKQAKKAKRKLPLNLQPSPEFIPVNPNF